MGARCSQFGKNTGEPYGAMRVVSGQEESVLSLKAVALFAVAQSLETASMRVQEGTPGNGPRSRIQASPSSLVVHGATLRSLVQWAWDIAPLAILPAQTGLKLDSRCQPVDLLIVDHVGALEEN